jgi:hypothetical protein
MKMPSRKRPGTGSHETLINGIVPVFPLFFSRRFSPSILSVKVPYSMPVCHEINQHEKEKGRGKEKQQRSEQEEHSQRVQEGC